MKLTDAETDSFALAIWRAQLLLNFWKQHSLCVMTLQPLSDCPAETAPQNACCCTFTWTLHEHVETFLQDFWLSLTPCKPCLNLDHMGIGLQPP